MQIYTAKLEYLLSCADKYNSMQHCNVPFRRHEAEE